MHHKHESKRTRARLSYIPIILFYTTSSGEKGRKGEESGYCWRDMEMRMGIWRDSTTLPRRRRPFRPDGNLSAPEGFNSASSPTWTSVVAGEPPLLHLLLQRRRRRTCPRAGRATGLEEAGRTTSVNRVPAYSSYVCNKLVVNHVRCIWSMVAPGESHWPIKISWMFNFIKISMLSFDKINK